MTSSKPKAREVAKRETREALLQAGIEMLSETGLDQPSLDTICARAGFTRGAFYVHFKDRTEFLIAVLDEALRRFVDSVISDRGPGDVATTIGQFLDAAGEERLPVVGKHGSFTIAMKAVHQVPEARDRYAAVLRATLERLSQVADRDQQAGGVRDDVPPAQVAMILVTAAIGVGTLLDVGVDVDLQALHAAAMRLIRASEA